jgi:type I restriction enzyme S subunit
LGKTAYIKKDTNWAYSNHMTRVRLHPGFHSGWVAYALHHLFLIGFFRMNCRHHVNQASINTNFLSTQTAIPIPPLPEQHRIVAEIETQFARLDAAVAALKRAQANLRRYKASVLKAACEGRLVPTEAELARAEGRAYEPADQLLARILIERRAKWEAENPGKRYKEPALPDIDGLPELPEGWCWATGEQINPATRSCAYGVLQPGPHVEDGIPLVRVGDIQDGRITIEGMKRVSPEIASKYSRTKLEGGEVLISLVGAIGRTAVVPSKLAGANTARAVGVVPLNEELDALWVEIWFRNPEKIYEMTMKAHEVARKTLNLEDVRAATVALPPLAEQRRIVAEVERRLSVVAALEASVVAELARAARLRQSILKRAFEGRLVPQDPNDEPASVLLERIRAEREKRKDKV